MSDPADPDPAGIDPIFAETRFFTRYYLLGTVLFWALDVLVSIPVRAAFTGRPRMRYGYYLALLGLGLACRRWPRAAPLLGICESGLNLTLLVLSIMLPVFSLVDQVESGPLALPFTTWTFVNFAIAGTVMVWTLRRHQSALRDRIRGA